MSGAVTSIARLLCGIALYGATAVLHAQQVTRADYERAAVFQNARALVSGLSVTPNWIERGDRFWYLREQRRGKSFVLVEPASNTQRAAFDHARLAAALSIALGQNYTADALPFDVFEYRDSLQAIAFKVADANWHCDLREYQCARTGRSFGAREGEALSPDGRWAVFSRGSNLWVRDTATDEETALTHDGEALDAYGQDVNNEMLTQRMLQSAAAPDVRFSPDSTKLLSYRADLRDIKELSLIETVPAARPRLHSYRSPIAGDSGVSRIRMYVVDLQRKSVLAVKHPRFDRVAPYETTVGWSSDSSKAFFTQNTRGYKISTLHAVDTRSGATRAVVEERSSTYVNWGQQLHALGDGRRLLWSSERDGWNHLYLIDSVTRRVTHQLTRGSWVVHDIVYVDEKLGHVYFRAGGKEAGQDPYYRHLYRVRLDGTGLEHLTPEPADHEISFSPTGRYFIDTYSRIDSPPVSVLRAANGRKLRELQAADIEPLLAAGWRAPEPFKARSADGTADIHGAIFRPSNFDPGKRYPVLDAIYPGPQVIRTPKAFRVKAWENEQALAELGFVVVTVDGRGTPQRSRAFREASYGRLGDGGGLEDHIAALRQLAVRYPCMDLSRVGIYGDSGGGYASARAILKFPDFYKVAVSLAGNHEQRSYWAEWGERWQGFPVGENFSSQANASLAAQLRGRLLLAFGDLDDNVHPSNSLQLIDALIAANRNFDVLILPNRNHTFVDLAKGRSAATGRADPYFLRRRWDYFVEHLLGVTPPREFPLQLTAR